MEDSRVTGDLNQEIQFEHFKEWWMLYISTYLNWNNDFVWLNCAQTHTLLLLRVSWDKPGLRHISHLWNILTSGSDSSVLGGGVSLGGFFSSLGGPMLGGGRWKSLDWSCCALGQGRVPLTHSTGSSHTALWPCTWENRQRAVAELYYKEKLLVDITDVRLWRFFCFHLDTVFGSLLQVWYDRVVPEVNEPLPELCHWHWAWQEEARTWGIQHFLLIPVYSLSQLPQSDPSDPVSTVSHLWGSLTCCVSPGKCAGGTRAEGSSREHRGEPGGVLSPAPPPGRPPQLYDAGTSAETRLPVPHYWRTSPFCWQKKCFNYVWALNFA